MKSQSKNYQLRMFSTGIQTKCISALIILCACLLEKGSTQTTPAPTTVGVGTTNVENFITMNRRQYASVISAMDLSLSNFRENYASQVSTIDSQTGLLEQRLQDAAASLNPLDVLSTQSRSCVQKYRGNIATADSIRTTLNACAAAATNALPTYLASALTTRNQLSTYYISSVDNLLTACSRTYPLPNGLANYTACVETAMRTANTVTVTNQKAFDSQLQVAQCSATQRIRDSIDCGYTAQYTAIGSIAENTRLINNCIAGLETCPVCPAPPAVTNTACPNTVQITAADAAATKETIVNPFRNLTNSTICVELRINSTAV